MHTKHKLLWFGVGWLVGSFFGLNQVIALGKGATGKG